MHILMSNYCGKLWDLDAGCRSAFWSNNGIMIAELNEASLGLVIVEKQGDIWQGKTIVVE